MESAFLSGDAAALTAQLAELRRDCPNEPLVETAGRALQGQVAHDEGVRSRVWDAIVQALAPELAMLESLDLSTAGARTIEAVIDPLARSFELQPPKPLLTAENEPVAWIVEGSRL